MLSTGPEDVVEDAQQGGTAKGEVTPLVRGPEQGADQTADDHDEVQKDDEENGGPGNSGGQEDVKQQQGSRDEPVRMRGENPSPWDLVERGFDLPINVAYVEDLTIDTTNESIATPILDGDRGPSEIGGHAEVGDGGHERDAGGDVVKDSMRTRLAKAHPKKDQSGEGHEGGDGPVPVGSMSGDVNIAGLAIDDVGIDSKSVVPHG